MHMQEGKQPGKVSELWTSSVGSSGVEEADVSAALSELLATKDTADIQKAKKAAFLASSVMHKLAVPKLESKPVEALCLCCNPTSCTFPSAGLPSVQLKCNQYTRPESSGPVSQGADGLSLADACLSH